MNTNTRIALIAAAVITVGGVILSREVGPLATTLYFLPTLVALARQHDSAPAAMKANLFFGWTVIGWCVAMNWACTGKGDLKRTIFGTVVSGVATFGAASTLVLALG